ncbi:hypothetical protein [Halorubrum sp. AS12]|uniref:hypothetical protein n=1 Tax=Halorubrum sp. AS12 TaxID=3409687 RepID=UPI003DA77400
MEDTVAVEYECEGRDAVGTAAWRILENYAEHADDDILETITRRLPIALPDFPALAHETVNIGILYENADAAAQAFGYNRLLCLPPESYITNITLWHELGHVAIRVRHERGEDVSKTSEEYCSIFSVARMPPEAIDDDRIPYLGEPDVDRAEWPRICRAALEYREERGPNSHYIKKAEQRLGIAE